MEIDKSNVIEVRATLGIYYFEKVFPNKICTYNRMGYLATNQNTPYSN